MQINKELNYDDDYYYYVYYQWYWHEVAQWLKHYATGQKIVGSKPDVVIEFYQFS
jgi:hypothetical protein